MFHLAGKSHQLWSSEFISHRLFKKITMCFEVQLRLNKLSYRSGVLHKFCQSCAGIIGNTNCLAS